MLAKIHERWTDSQIDLWERVRAQIVAHPESYDQDRFHVFNVLAGGELKLACIGGWGHTLSGCCVPHDGLATNLACTAVSFGLSSVEGSVVFSALPVEWPDPFRAINAPAGDPVKAGIAAAYIDWIVRNGRVAA